MTNFTVEVRADEHNVGSNLITVVLDTEPKQELMVGTTRGDDLDEYDDEIEPEDLALYYAVERIAQLEGLLKEWQERTGVPIDLVGDYKRIVMQEATNANG